MIFAIATVFIPHRYCMGLDSGLIWLSVITDALVALSYYSIPAALFILVFRGRQSLSLQPLLILFGLFIAFCGGGHAMDIVSLWKPIYWLKAWWNVGTAATSVITAIVLVPRVLEFVKMPEVTARLQRENVELEERQSLLRAVLDSTDEGIVLADESGRPTLFNSAAMAILPAEDHSAKRLPWKADPDAGAKIARLSNGKIVEYVTRGVPGYGQLSVFRDLTSQRHSEEQRLRLDRIIQTMKQGFCILSPESGAIISTNVSFEQMYGADPGSLIGVRIGNLLAGPAEEARAQASAILAQARRDTYWEGEVGNKRVDGTEFVASCRINLHSTDDQSVLSLIQVDITEQKRVADENRRIQEKLNEAAKLESIGLLAGGVAHDFNNLLTGILGNASLVYDQLSPSSSLRERVSDVIRASERASALTHQLLAFAGKGRFVIETLELNQVIVETKELLRRVIPTRVELKLELGPEMRLKGDPSQIPSILMNILINAAESIPEGQQGQIVIRTKAESLDQQKLQTERLPETMKPGLFGVLEVIDNGIGMDQQTLAKIFEPFFTTKFTGRGLGLSAATGVVRSHGGTIKVDSEPGKGTRFCIYLPVLDVVNSEKQGSPAREKDNLRGHGSVLIIDDEAAVLQTARNTLRHYGYETMAASDGRSGVAVFAQAAEDISLVLLDWTMPMMSGDEVLRALRLIRPDVPVLLSSGFSETEAIARFEGLHLEGFLQKPYTSGALAAKVKAIIESNSGDAGLHKSRGNEA